MHLPRRKRRIKDGDEYSTDENVELEDVEAAKQLEPGELSEPWNTGKIPRERWRTSGD